MKLINKLLNKLSKNVTTYNILALSVTANYNNQLTGGVLQVIIN